MIKIEFFSVETIEEIRISGQSLPHFEREEELCLGGLKTRRTTSIYLSIRYIERRAIGQFHLECLDSFLIILQPPWLESPSDGRNDFENTRRTCMK